MLVGEPPSVGERMAGQIEQDIPARILDHAPSWRAIGGPCSAKAIVVHLAQVAPAGSRAPLTSSDSTNGAPPTLCLRAPESWFAAGFHCSSSSLIAPRANHGKS